MIDFGPLRSELHLPGDFPPEVTAAAAQATDAYAADRVDLTALPFVTIDPPGSKDLDQALLLERHGAGYRVYYAIADVAALVPAGGPVDTESRRRGQTIYLPDGSIPLHPRELSEGAGSLLPDQVRPAVVWQIDLDAAGEQTAVTVQRATVTSVARLDYAGVQGDADAKKLHPSIEELPTIGELRIARAAAHGAIELGLPEQDVVRDGEGWTLVVESRTRADAWNAQISLLTGMAAGHIMRDAGVGILRTLPTPDAKAVSRLHDSAQKLGVTWPENANPGEFLASLDPAAPSTLALMSDATALLRGADYLVLGEPPQPAGSGAATEKEVVTEHAGIGGVYAHVTAPLRRLADRFATEVCLALVAAQPVPDWVTAALPEVADTMRTSDRAANAAARAAIDLAEAELLTDRVGEHFQAVVMHEARGERPAQIFIAAPAIVADCAGEPSEGTAVEVVLTRADRVKRRVEFAPA